MRGSLMIVRLYVFLLAAEDAKNLFDWRALALLFCVCHTLERDKVLFLECLLSLGGELHACAVSKVISFRVFTSSDETLFQPRFERKFPSS